MVCSTNRATISYARLVPSPLALKKRVILSSDFCEQMLRLATSARTLRLAVKKEDEYGYALFSADDVLLFGRLVFSDEPLDFVGMVKRHVPREYRSQSIAIPKALHAVVKCCTRVTNVIGSETRTAISLRDGIATFTAKSDRGIVTDSSTTMPGHPDAKLDVNACLLLTGLAWAQRILFTPDCAIMSAGQQFYLCAAFEEDC